MPYVDPDLVNDEVSVAESALTGVADRIPGWVPYEGHTEVALAESVGIAIATAVTFLKKTAKATYVGFGQRVLGIPLIPQARAASTVTIILSDDQTPAGLDIPVGTELDATGADNSTVVFYTAEGTVVPPAQGTATGVPVVAQLAGPEANDTAGEASTPLAGIQQVTFDAPAAGGVNDETEDAYAGRLADRAKRMHVLPVTVADYAALALDVAGVARAYAVNVYNPATPGTVAPGHLSIAGLQDDGGTLTPTIASNLSDYLTAAERPLSVILHTITPMFVAINVAAEIRLAQVGVDELGQPILADPDATTSLAQGAVARRFDPAYFDKDTSSPGGWSLVPSREVTIFDAAQAIEQVIGVSHVAECTINGGTAPVALPEPLSMPQLGTVTITVAE